MAKMQYIVLAASVVGSGPFTTEYSFDGQKFNDRQSAISHGLTIGRSDDFNIGVLRDGKLISLDWMDRTVDADPAELEIIAKSAGL